MLSALPLADRYGALGEDFFTRVDPSPLADPYLVAVSAPACGLVGVDPATLGEPESLAALAGNAVLPNSRPLAAVYAGHQFGVWAGRLGDGRALLLGDAPAKAASGYRALGGSDQQLLDFDRWELQLKLRQRTPPLSSIGKTASALPQAVCRSITPMRSGGSKASGK